MIFLFESETAMVVLGIWEWKCLKDYIANYCFIGHKLNSPMIGQ